MTKKKRKPQYQPVKGKHPVDVMNAGRLNVVSTTITRSENAIAPTDPALRAKATGIDVRHSTVFRSAGDIAAEQADRRKRLTGSAEMRDPLLSAIRAHRDDPAVTGYVSQKWVAGESHDVSLGEAEMNLPMDQVLRHMHTDIAMHQVDDAHPHDPRLPKRLTDKQTDRIIYEHPKIAMEGLAKLGRVIQVPMTTERDSGVHIPPFDALELKAKVANDLASHRYVNTITNQGTAQVYSDLTASILSDATVVDCQPVYDRWMVSATGNDLYDLRLAPPWYNALLMYNNTHGNVWAMHMVGSDIMAKNWSDVSRAEIEWQPQEPANHKIEWDQVRWVYSVQVYVGGLGRVGTDAQRTLAMQPTTGPLMVWRIAVYEDGVPADIHWTHVSPDVPFHKFNNAMGALTETINMCNCINVHVAESERNLPRAQRRRLARYGVRFSEVHIRPASKSYKGNGTRLADMQVPIHGVIGHYNTYGSNGRGLLFGKYAGRFWIPPHVRGSKEVGEVQQRYVAEQ